MIDCHCHMLPGIDDGAKDLDQSLAMARKAVESGITAAVLTPHNLNGVYTNKRSFILKEVAQFRLQLAEYGISLDVHPGSELHLVPELPDQLQQGEAMTYADRGKAVLLELPKNIVPMGTEQLIETLLYRGLTPVIAHPERNTTLRRDQERVGEWVVEGCKLQLTAQSCSGEFGRGIQSVCKYWCTEGWVHLVASDAHRPQGRAPDLRSGAAKIRMWMGDEAVRVMTLENPHRLISGDSVLDVIPGKKKDYRVFSLFRR